MRDIYKDEVYFEEQLEENTEFIEYFENERRDILKASEVIEKQLWDISGDLYNYYMQRIHLLYSIGTRDEEIPEYLKKCFGAQARFWTPTTGYVDLMQGLSFAVLSNEEVDTNALETLCEKLKEYDYGDWIVDYFIKYLRPDWEIRSTEFQCKGFYESIKKVVEAVPEERITILKEYLEKKWYRSNRQQYWHDSHKSINNTYFGYWSFESAAVMKILGEDDSLLKDQKYYPYYMNHMV